MPSKIKKANKVRSVQLGPKKKTEKTEMLHTRCDVSLIRALDGAFPPGKYNRSDVVRSAIRLQIEVSRKLETRVSDLERAAKVTGIDSSERFADLVAELVIRGLTTVQK